MPTYASDYMVTVEEKVAFFDISLLSFLHIVKGTHARDFMVRFSQFFGIIQ